MKTKILISVLGLFLMVSVSFAAEVLNQYQAVEIAKFEVANGIKFPDDYLASLNGDLVEQLQNLKKFQEVRLIEGSTEAPAQQETKTLRITGEITEYKPGSKVGRALFGMLAGETKVKAQIRIVDSLSGELLLEDDVDGKVTYWSPDQDSKGATKGLAKEVAKVIKKKF